MITGRSGYQEQNENYPVNHEMDFIVLELKEKFDSIQEQINQGYEKQDDIRKQVKLAALLMVPFDVPDHVFLIGQNEGWHQIEEIFDVLVTKHERGFEFKFCMWVRKLGKRGPTVGNRIKINYYINKNLNGWQIEDHFISEVRRKRD